MANAGETISIMPHPGGRKPGDSAALQPPLGKREGMIASQQLGLEG